MLHERLAGQGMSEIEEILNYELSLYSVEPPRFVGWRREFIAAARLDNLLSCFAGIESLLEASEQVTSLVVCNDHEEVGSASAAGAHGTFLKSLLERLCGDADQLGRTVNRSLLISADNSHGIHPNYPDKHDARHGPILNQGPVIKINSNQRYATNSETAAFFQQLCREVEVPTQVFVNRTDMACGSTIGPITATETGIRTLDIGVPTFAMHSSRELCGSRDPHLMFQALRQFFRHRGPLSPIE
jgi:aspartyl aminopeptidase